MLEIKEEEVERGVVRSVIIEGEGKKILKMRWVTGKTSAGRLFGRYGREGRPDFFRLLFGVLIGSLREQLGEEEGVEQFNRIRDSKNFKDSVSKVFDEVKSWFFNEIVPKYRIEPGDVFTITTELDLDLEGGDVSWIKDASEIIYWIRSDRVVEKCKEFGVKVEEVSKEDIEKLREQLEDLAKDYNDLKTKYEELIKEKERVENERDMLRIELDTVKIELNNLREENERLKGKIEELRKVLA